MNFSALDGFIVLAYLVVITLIGFRIARRQKSSVDYFLGGHTLSWWAVGCSIVASETSTLTFISVPGLAYKGEYHFLQLALGYLVGRLLVSVFFIPAYYRGKLQTAYEFLGRRFGVTLRRTTSVVFIVTRVLASGVRLFAAAIPVHILTGLSYPMSIFLVGSFTLFYTLVGGLRAVVTMDVLQLALYLAGAGASVLLMLHRMPGHLADVVAAATANGMNKFEVFNLSWGGSIRGFFSMPYTLLGGLLGGTFLTMASHGTDHLLVQRLLACRTVRDSQKALMLDAVLIVLQFAFFLFLGTCLYTFYHGVPYDQLGLASSDEIFPRFIIDTLPRGLAGLVIAGVLASAMGSLSSAINSLASSASLDLFTSTRAGSELWKRNELLFSRLFTVLWGCILMFGAMLFTDSHSTVVELGLRITSFTYGGLLGTFFLGLFDYRANETGALTGFLAGVAAMSAVLALADIDLTWHTMIGCLVTVAVGSSVSRLRSRGLRR
ncbi:MAG TPA: sodium:solute symporter [Bacteroidota bacterium]|nr:sodium:solute symporter [Bacteroidota bacterium]